MKRCWRAALAQPLSRTQLLLGKHAGLLLAITAATVAGFVPAGVLITAAAGPALILPYLLFPALAVLAAAAMTGIGLLISVTSRSAVQAQGAAVFAWFAFALPYDLVVIGLLASGGMPAEWLAATLVANPIDATRVLKPAPRDHTDAAYMNTITDEMLGKIVQQGGAVQGKPNMPSNPQIRGNDLAALVGFVRTLSRQAQ